MSADTSVTAVEPAPVEGAVAPYFCVATRLRVRGPRQLPGFFRATIRVRREARTTPGFAGIRLVPWHPSYYTLTVWEDEAAMRAFVRRPHHRVAMSRIGTWASTSEYVEFRSTSARPRFAEIRDRLRTPDKASTWERPVPRGARAGRP